MLVSAGGQVALEAGDLDAMLRDALVSMSRRDAVQAVADISGVARKQVYARALSLDDAALDDAHNNKNKQRDNDPPPD